MWVCWLKRCPGPKSIRLHSSGAQQRTERGKVLAHLGVELFGAHRHGFGAELGVTVAYVGRLKGAVEFGVQPIHDRARRLPRREDAPYRSEEHTSELQS